jgi:uracil-DNA glycosylase family 4
MSSGITTAIEFFSQRAELGESDFFLSPAFSRASFLIGKKSSLAPVRPAAQEKKTTMPAAADSSKREMLKQLYFSLAGCQRCVLGKTRTKLVFGSGNAEAAIMVIGEAPGADEDSQGLPFVGRAGQLLTQMLASINLDRTKEVFITNVVKCRPPENRNPESSEITACSPCLQRQIEIIKPKIILLLGRIAAGALLNATAGVGQLRAVAHSYQDIPVCVTYHPAALLRKEEYKRSAWEDLKKFEVLLRQMGLR